MSEPGQWHGWTNGENAIFISPLDEERLGLFIQQGRSTDLVGVFVDPAMAQVFMDWMDDSLTETAKANLALVKQLQEEQPLIFAQGSMQPPDFDDEDDDGD